MSDNKNNEKKKEYKFGGVKEFSLEQIESEILNESVYLDVFAGSDMRFKENVSDLEKSLPLINQLKGYRYNYRTQEFTEKNFPQGAQIGLMGQDVEKVAPELTKKDEKGYLHVNYAGLVPLLVNGINELEKRLAESEEEIKSLKAQLKSK